MKTLLSIFVLSAAPLAALAYECSSTTAMTCAEGSTYDAESQTCVPVTG